MEKIIFRKLLLDITLRALTITFSLGLIVWIVQAVNYLDFVIGDRVDTDIFFGTKLNAKTVLVNSGVSNFEDANNADIVIESFSKVVPFIF